MGAAPMPQQYQQVPPTSGTSYAQQPTYQPPPQGFYGAAQPYQQYPPAQQYQQQPGAPTNQQGLLQSVVYQPELQLDL